MAQEKYLSWRCDRIDYVKKEAGKMGLRNLYPVLVDKEGVDDFYSNNKYDLIFICNVYHRFNKWVNYIRKVRDFLSPDGEVVVILYKSVVIFQLDDIVNFKSLVRELSRESHENKPFYENLRQSTRDLIKQQSNHNPDDALKNAIVSDFN